MRASSPFFSPPPSRARTSLTPFLPIATTHPSPVLPRECRISSSDRPRGFSRLQGWRTTIAQDSRSRRLQPVRVRSRDQVLVQAEGRFGRLGASGELSFRFDGLNAEETRPDFRSISPRSSQINYRWPSYVQLNVYGFDDFFFGDADGDGVLDRLPPNSLSESFAIHSRRLDSRRRVLDLTS